MRSERETLFDARESRCEKCGSDDVIVKWHGRGADHPSRRYDRCRRYGESWGKPGCEHLHYHCRTCQFDWTGKVATTSLDFSVIAP